MLGSPKVAPMIAEAESSDSFGPTTNTRTPKARVARISSPRGGRRRSYQTSRIRSRSRRRKRPSPKSCHAVREVENGKPRSNSAPAVVCPAVVAPATAPLSGPTLGPVSGSNNLPNAKSPSKVSGNLNIATPRTILTINSMESPSPSSVDEPTSRSDNLRLSISTQDSERSTKRLTLMERGATGLDDTPPATPTSDVGDDWSSKSAAYRSKAPNLRARLWDFVDVPTSSPGAKVFSIVVMALILVSVFTFCIETLPLFHKRNVLVWFTIETVCIAIFTVEFALRIASAPNTCKFMYDVYTIIDIGAIFPYYVEVIIDIQDGVMFNVSDASVAAPFLRVFRLLRVLRVIKMARYLSWMKLFTVSLKQSLAPLGMFCFFVAIVIIVFSTIMYYVERGAWIVVDGVNVYVIDSGVGAGQRSQFNSIPDAMYWCIITMTTVGYGDIYPQSTPGKLVAALASLTGIFVLAIPITIISSEFNREYERERQARAEKQAKMQTIRNHFRMKRKGFSSLADEIENMVTHKTAMYKKKVLKMIDDSRAELIDEIQELVRLAYQCRVANDKSAGTLPEDA